MSSYSLTSIRDAFLHGILACTFIFSFLYIPWLILREIFVYGLKEIPLIVALSVLVAGIVMNSTLKLGFSVRKKIFWILSFICSILCMLSGMLAFFSFDNTNILTILVLSSLLAVAYLVAQFYFAVFDEKQINQHSKYKKYYLLGLLVVPSIIYMFQWITPQIFEMKIYLDTVTSTLSDGTLLITLAIFYLFIPYLSNLLINTDKRENPKLNSKIKSKSLGLKLFFIMLIGVLLNSLILYCIFVEVSEWSSISYLGISIGIGLGSIIFHKSNSFFYNSMLSGLGIVIIYFWFSISAENINNVYFMLVLGVILGLTFHNIFVHLKILKTSSVRSTHLWIFIFLIIVSLSGVLAGQIRWLVRDYPEFMPLLNFIIIFLNYFTILIENINKENINKIISNISNNQSIGILKDISSEESKNEPSNNTNWKLGEDPINNNNHVLLKRDISKIKKILLAITLSILMIMPLFLGVLYNNARINVIVKLDQPMYTVNGDLLTEVSLNARSGCILLYDNPNSPETSFSSSSNNLPKPYADSKLIPYSSLGSEKYVEYIRIGKSIRLGAYLYGGTENLTSEEAVDWIGNNLDVFALGGWPGFFFECVDIDAIRTINPNSRFYIMTFATSFYEDPRNNITETGGTLLPNTSWGIAFNETMHEWTLKLKNGTETYGLHHWPGSMDHIMDLGNEEWAKFYAWFFQQRANEFHANGVAIDEVMWRGYWGTDINNLRDYSTIEEITETCYDWLRVVDENMDVEVITQAFWDEAQQYQQGVWGELSFRCGGAYGGRADDRQQNVFYETANWMEIVDNMYNVASANKSYIWAAWYDRDDPEALEYAISTYLMGKPNNCSSLGFHPQPIYEGGYPANLAGYDMKTVREEVNNHPEFFNLELGQALNYMKLNSGLGGSYWRRDFENGIILVNPYHAQIPGFQNNAAQFAPSH